MNKWYLFDTKSGNTFQTPLRSTGKTNAIREAVQEWKALSSHDKRLREGFVIALVDEHSDAFFPDDFIDEVDILEAVKQLDVYEELLSSMDDDVKAALIPGHAKGVTASEASMRYERTHFRQVSVNFQKEYYWDILKPAADEANMTVAAFIKKAISERIRRLNDGEDKA